jgi:hypothetical protein
MCWVVTLVVGLVALGGVLCSLAYGVDVSIRPLGVRIWPVSAERLVAVLAALWFLAYGIGTTWQLVYERPYQNALLQRVGQPTLPSFTCWTVITQVFSNGLWAAAGWPAAYVVWRLWRDHWRDSPKDINAGGAALALALLLFALLSVTGWLPARLEGIFGRK